MPHVWHTILFFPPPTHLKDVLISWLHDLSVRNAKTSSAGRGNNPESFIQNTNPTLTFASFCEAGFDFLRQRISISIIQVLKSAVVNYNRVPWAFYARWSAWSRNCKFERISMNQNGMKFFQGLKGDRVLAIIVSTVVLISVKMWKLQTHTQTHTHASYNFTRLERIKTNESCMNSKPRTFPQPACYKYRLILITITLQWRRVCVKNCRLGFRFDRKCKEVSFHVLCCYWNDPTSLFWSGNSEHLVF